MFLITNQEAEKKALAITNDGMHFKGQYLPKESFNLLGKEVKFISKAFECVSLVEYENKEYFISDDLIKK